MMGNTQNKQSTFGMLPQELRIIRETWKFFRRDLARNGLVVLAIFFNDYPHNRRYFPFMSQTLDELEHEPLAKLHALRIMRELSFCVDNIDNVETLLCTLRLNALNHRKRNIMRTAYDEMRLSILKALASQIGSLKFIQEAEQAWDKALRVIFQIITNVNEEKKCICAQASSNNAGTSSLRDSDADADSSEC